MEDIFAGEVDGCINIHSRSRDPRARLLSALANRPFQIEDQWFASLEGLYQGILFPPEDQRRFAAFASCFGYAQKFGKLAEKMWVWWDQDRFSYAGMRHLQIVEVGFVESFRQCPDRLEALCQTNDLVIVHETDRVGDPDPVMPSWRFCEYLTKIRTDELARRSALK